MIPYIKYRLKQINTYRYFCRRVEYIVCTSMSVTNSYNSHKVWSRFNATRKDGSVIKLRIQDLPWNKHKENITEFYMQDFIRDETFHKAAGIADSEEAVAEYKQLLIYSFDDKEPHVSICCVDDDSDKKEIIGMSLLNNLNADDDVEFKPRTKELQNLINIYSVIKDINASKGFATCYDGRGIVVRADYRGLGIANEFVRLRKQICIDENVQMTSAWMTALGTQKAAAKYNWRTFVEIPVEEVEKRCGIPLGVNIPTLKLMYTTKE